MPQQTQWDPSSVEPLDVDGAALLKTVTRTELLPTLPTVALEVLVLTNKSDCTLDQLALCIQNDAALTASILRAINSPLFGVSQHVSSIKQASALLGLRRLRILALSFTIVPALATHYCEDFDYPTFWKHSLTTAVAARLLAAAASPELAEEAFICGLLYNIGLIAASVTSPEQFGRLSAWWQMKGSWDVDDEVRYLGANHAQLSAAVLKTWGIPDCIVHTIACYRESDDPSANDRTIKLRRTIRAAVTLSELFCGDLPCESIEECKDQCQELTGIDPKELESLLDSLACRVLETARMVSVPVGPTTSYDHLQKLATQQIEKLSENEGLGSDADLSARDSASIAPEAA